MSFYIYITYELTASNNVTRSTGLHIFPLLADATEQIGLPNCISMLHCSATVVYVT